MRSIRARLLVALLALAGALPVRAAVAGETRAPRVCVLPMGRHDHRLVDTVRRGIETLYAVPVAVLPRVELPERAWYAARKRHRAELLLEHIVDEVLPRSGCTFIVGFTAVDISTTKGEIYDWGVLGLGYLGGPVAVVSTFRTQRGARSRRHFAERTVKVVNHELGHVLGLPHEPTKGCIMNDAGGTVRTVDTETGLLCEACRRQIELRHGVTLPSSGRFDWKRVLGR